MMGTHFDAPTTITTDRPWYVRVCTSYGVGAGPSMNMDLDFKLNKCRKCVDLQLLVGLRDRHISSVMSIRRERNYDNGEWYPLSHEIFSDGGVAMWCRGPDRWSYLLMTLDCAKAVLAPVVLGDMASWVSRDENFVAVGVSFESPEVESRRAKRRRVQ